ncbi:hypothetical protein ABZ070_31675 [Streptomyces sp. NPDC006283]|uniref:hypothetical protein n=1 Tax=Streptomyces sp. NPDC006283 TaxID=3156741 RepID=UPI0033BE0880
MWECTKTGKYRVDSHEDAKPRKLGGAAGRPGRDHTHRLAARDYLKTLEEDVSGGAFADKSIEQLARRMYDAIAPVVDRIEKGKPPTEVPQAVVDDAAVPAGPEPSKAS